VNNTSRSRLAFPVTTLPIILLSGCLVNPTVDDIQPATVNACQKVDFTGTFVHITQGNLVDTSGTKIPLAAGTLTNDPIPGSQVFRVAIAMPPVPVGDYKISIDQTGGSVFFLGFVSAGSATSSKTFHVATTVQPPLLMLTATNSTGPGAPAVLTPSVAGTGTAAIFPGNLSGSVGPRTVHACKTTTYALGGENQCATAQSAKATVTVAGPVITDVTPSSAVAGGFILVAGTGFNDPAFCGNTEVSLTNGATTYVLATQNGTPVAVSAAINSCVPGGKYDVIVKTSEGSAKFPTKLTVQPFVGTACPDDGNQCTKDMCVNGACAHQPLNGTTCGTEGKCSMGACIMSKTSLPAQMCVKALPPPTNPNLNECVPDGQLGNHCCNSASAPAACINGVCFLCIAHGAACGTPGSRSSLCCSQGDACVSDPVTAATTCNVPSN
jgi:hypothetical protein